MSAAEMGLIITALAILFITNWQVRKLGIRYRFYVSLAAAILLVALVWFDDTSKPFWPQILLTIIALSSVVRTYKELQKKKSDAIK